MYIKPTHDHVPDIDRGGYLATEGREVEPTQYWLRRLQDGDVTEAPAAVSSPRESTSRKGQ
jgi:hypothetical protein